MGHAYDGRQPGPLAVLLITAVLAVLAVAEALPERRAAQTANSKIGISSHS